MPICLLVDGETKQGENEREREMKKKSTDGQRKQGKQPLYGKVSFFALVCDSSPFVMSLLLHCFTLSPHLLHVFLFLSLSRSPHVRFAASISVFVNDFIRLLQSLFLLQVALVCPVHWPPVSLASLSCMPSVSPRVTCLSRPSDIPFDRSNLILFSFPLLRLFVFTWECFFLSHSSCQLTVGQP